MPCKALCKIAVQFANCKAESNTHRVHSFPATAGVLLGCLSASTFGPVARLEASVVILA